MKIKNNSKRVEKKYSYRLAKVTLLVKQKECERGAFVILRITYKVAYTDAESLSKFVLSVKSDPTKYYNPFFCFCTPVVSKVDVDYIDKDLYSIGEESIEKDLIVVDLSHRFRFRDKLQHNRNIIQYKSDIEL